MTRDLLPLDALDQNQAIVGKTGSGKTYLAKGQAEQLLRERHRVCIIDPLGVWWGLRAGADGKAASGFPILVIGGEHGDLQLEEHHAEALGQSIGSGTFSCVIDLSALRGNAPRTRFMTRFLEALYETNREPLNLMLDEADSFGPQRPMPDETAMLGRMQHICRRGRVKGFFTTLITQRPAVLNKDLLSQADILIAMKLPGPQDRAAIGAWIEGQADRDEGKRILADLPKLKQGEAWLWWPGGDRLDRVKAPAITTYDSSRTPKRGERAKTPELLRDIDLGAVTAALAAAEAPAEKKAKGKAGPSDAEIEAALERARDAGFTEGFEAGYRRGYVEGGDVMGESVGAAIDKARTFMAYNAEQSTMRIPPPSGDASRPTRQPKLDDPDPEPSIAPAPAKYRHAAVNGLAEAPTKARKMLHVLLSRAPAWLTWAQVATLAHGKARGGTFTTARSWLRSSGLIEEDGELIRASDAARAKYADQVPPPPKTETEALELWCAALPSPAPDMLRWLHRNARSRPVALDTLAQGLERAASGGTWNGGVGALKRNGLVLVDGGTIRLKPLLPA